MTAKEIYETILDRIEATECSICNLHIPCKDLPACNILQQTHTIDFDKVKEVWNKLHKKESESSTDGLTYSPSEEILCFVEIKGWKKFLEFNKTLNKRLTNHQNLSEAARQRILQDIDKQNKKYNLQKKLNESISICEEIINTKELDKTNRIIFILVTDVDPNKDALQVLNQQLQMLANTSSDWESVCASKLRTHLEKSISRVSTGFIYCKDFDKYMSNL